MAKQENNQPNAYKFNEHRKRHRIIIEVVTDMVPGWGYDIQDHIDQIFRSDSYVVSAEVMED